MKWEMLCPGCRGVKADATHLSELQAVGHCGACNLDFEPDVDELIEKEQKELNRVEGDYESLKKVKLLAAMRTKAAKIARYSNGDSSPYRIQYMHPGVG